MLNDKFGKIVKKGKHPIFTRQGICILSNNMSNYTK